MYVLHPPKGQREKSTDGAHWRFLGKGEEKIRQYREVRAHFEHRLYKNCMKGYWTQKWEYKLSISLHLTPKSFDDTKMSENKLINKNSKVYGVKM